MKEPGVSQNGFIHGAEVIEYDPTNPQIAISNFVNFAIPRMEAKARVGGIIKAGLMIGGGVLLYKLLTSGDDEEDEDEDEY